MKMIQKNIKAERHHYALVQTLNGGFISSFVKTV